MAREAGLAPRERRRSLAPMDKPIAKPSIRESNERAILAAAEAVFAERGFSGATMSAIAARAGVAQGQYPLLFSDQGDGSTAPWSSAC